MRTTHEGYTADTRTVPGDAHQDADPELLGQGKVLVREEVRLAKEELRTEAKQVGSLGRDGRRAAPCCSTPECWCSPPSWWRCWTS